MKHVDLPDMRLWDASALTFHCFTWPGQIQIPEHRYLWVMFFPLETVDRSGQRSIALIVQFLPDMVGGLNKNSQSGVVYLVELPWLHLTSRGRQMVQTTRWLTHQKIRNSLRHDDGF
ncbi:hypothetical protein HRR83_009019 [Exophiala dermatitidis]|uniref:Uncharacterized protein n=1 Tax=Exophiala dermatitidis TaxID=5970 RepID=A0AAN6EKJ3_EXODE|nr:hypothetical protein HRR73_009069 [Exophiala dermatitidis]KAJ4504046.1 hypothetical protein HRR74_009067 [Exophiala dermatitidis]KAJ4528967.1 hypothetical protein HRR76_009580 [Exophiala dermatitidis]KAJ4533193.1 hypothetical protein HRR77_008904 [Exophiala dermatitidis]KAJ4555909.1 hypothetical protein HRR79_009005 [Exophiala dermatitidis]